MQPVKEILVFGITVAEHRQGEIMGLEHVRQDLLHQFNTLLIGQATDHAEQGAVEDVLQPQFLGQRVLVLFLSGEIGSGLGMGNQGIVLRVPFAVIHAVEDTHH